MHSHRFVYSVSVVSFFTLFLFVCLIAPVSAQSTTTIDGSNDSPTERRQYIRGWRGQSSDLQQKIQTLGSTSSAVVPLPVLFGVELSNLRTDFGDPRSNGRTHIGNDIMAPRGTPIVSPTPAVVLRIGTGSGEGNYVYTANPGGETFVYMHLDTFGEGIAQGTVLEKGSIIGYVGNTGNASGGAPHLHFEIHTSGGMAIDPYTRINATFSLEEKMRYVTTIFSTHKDQSMFAQLMANTFASTFLEATARGISYPEAIKNNLTSLPVPSSPVTTSLPPGDLELGSKGVEVVQLQQYLIARNTGPYALRLSQAGATGNFGPMTEAALIEYQASANIIPSDGYYGPTTRSHVKANPATNPAPTPTTPSQTTILTRDLSLQSTGEDVRTLQKFLNKQGYMVSSSGAGSLGAETTFFGPATQAAVIRFQSANNINPAVGYVGPITRKLIASFGV